MRIKFLLLSATLAAAVAAGGCEHAKSSNPLSPSIAGPIAGVNITPPKLLSPAAGSQIETAAQPVTLVLENATTNGQRPLSYLIEVALDADFNNKVLSRDGVVPGGNGQTTFKLPEALAAERTYYWRARAQDGANTGTFATGGYFSIFTPIVLQPPQLVSPINDAVISELNPTLVISNAARSGPVVTIAYELQVSVTEAFTQIVDAMEQAEQAGGTRKTVGTTLNNDTRYFWRARAWEKSKNVAGPWSATAAFKTPPAPVVTPPPGGGGSGGGGTAGHIKGPLNAATAEAIVRGTAEEFPHLIEVFSTDDAALAAAEELLLRTIWHLKLAGFDAARQRNPSGAISKDKLTIFIDGRWHVYDIYSLGYAGRATTVQFFEITGENPVPDPGIPD